MGITDRLRNISWIYPLLRWLRHRLGHALMRLCRGIWGIDRRRVLFSSYTGGGYSDNPRAVSEALHALRPDLEIEWELLPDAPREDVPDYIRIVPARTLKAVRAYATAAGFVLNNNRPGYMLKLPGQFYVQTWHGDRGFKRVGVDDEKMAGEPEVAECTENPGGVWLWNDGGSTGYGGRSDRLRRGERGGACQDGEQQSDCKNG